VGHVGEGGETEDGPERRRKDHPVPVGCMVRHRVEGSAGRVQPVGERDPEGCRHAAGVKSQALGKTNPAWPCGWAGGIKDDSDGIRGKNSKTGK